MPSKTVVPAGRRPIVRGEHLFTTGRKKRCGQHRMSVTSVGPSGQVVACMVCGKLKTGETMPDRWEPILP